MIAKEFVQKVGENQPDVSLFTRKWSKEKQEDLKRECEIPLSNDIHYQEYGNEILNLVLNYDVSNYRLFDLSFDKDIFETEDDVFFGWDIVGNRLGYSKITKEIFAYYVATDTITWYLSPNDEVFLDVLFQGHLFYNQSLILQEDDELLQEAIEKYVSIISFLLNDDDKYLLYHKYSINYKSE